VSSKNNILYGKKLYQKPSKSLNENFKNTFIMFIFLSIITFIFFIIMYLIPYSSRIASSLLKDVPAFFSAMLVLSIFSIFLGTPRTLTIFEKGILFEFTVKNFRKGFILFTDINSLKFGFRGKGNEIHFYVNLKNNSSFKFNVQLEEAVLIQKVFKDNLIEVKIDKKINPISEIDYDFIISESERKRKEYGILY